MSLSLLLQEIVEKDNLISVAYSETLTILLRLNAFSLQGKKKKTKTKKSHTIRTNNATYASAHISKLRYCYSELYFIQSLELTTPTYLG